MENLEDVKNLNSRAGEVSFRLSSSRTICPDSYICTLRYADTQQYVLNNVGLNFASDRFRPTGVFDVDPIVGGTATPGFNELAAMYGKYRTLSSSCSVNVSNLETWPLSVFLWPSNTDLGANYGNVSSALSMTYSKRLILSPVGGMDKGRISSKHIRTTEIVGTDEVLYDDLYASAVTGVPLKNWYWNIGIWSPNNLLANGVETSTEVLMVVQFYERKHMIV